MNNDHLGGGECRSPSPPHSDGSSDLAPFGRSDCGATPRAPRCFSAGFPRTSLARRGAAAVRRARPPRSFARRSSVAGGRCSVCSAVAGASLRVAVAPLRLRRGSLRPSLPPRVAAPVRPWAASARSAPRALSLPLRCARGRRVVRLGPPLAPAARLPSPPGVAGSALLPHLPRLRSVAPPPSGGLKGPPLRGRWRGRFFHAGGGPAPSGLRASRARCASWLAPPASARGPRRPEEQCVCCSALCLAELVSECVQHSDLWALMLQRFLHLRYITVAVHQLDGIGLSHGVRP